MRSPATSPAFPGLPRAGGRRRPLVLLLILPVLLADLGGCGREPAGGGPGLGGLLVPVGGGDLPRRGLTYGGAVLDCDGDGWPDLLASSHGDRAAVYLNRGGLRFVRPSADAVRLPDDLADQHGASACDVDGDGHDDVYLSVGAERGRELAWKRLWLQRQPGRFEEVLGDDPVLADPAGRGRGALWFDLDGDGGVELLVMNYQSQARLLRQEGGRWFDLGRRLPTPPAVPLWAPGLPPPSPQERERSTWVQAAVAADLDGDGAADLVAMGRPGWGGLWRNLDGGRLWDVTCLWGMGGAFFPVVPSHAAAGDVDEDGDLDLVLAYRPVDLTGGSFPGRLQVWLQEREGDSPFFRPGAGSERLEQLVGTEVAPEAVLLADLDDDGHLDIYAACRSAAGDVPDLLLLGDGKGGFEPAPAPGDLGGRRGSSEAVWAADLDRDGDLDLLRFEGGGTDPAAGGGIELVENRASLRGVTLELTSRGGPSHGIGARVELLRPDGPALLRQVQCLAVPYSGAVPPVHFGLGRSAGPWRVRVRWPGGAVQEVVLPEAGRAYRLQQQSGQVEVLPAGWSRAAGGRGS